MNDSACQRSGPLRRRVRRGAACASVLWALGSAAPSALAQQSDAAADDASRARELFAQAEQAYAAEAYAQAVNLLRRAFALSPRPAFLFNIAQAQRKLGQCDSARASYHDYLIRETNPAHRERVERILREMRSCDTGAAKPAAPEPPQPEASGAGSTKAAAPAPPPSVAPSPPAPARLPPEDAGALPGARIATWSLLGAGTLSAGLAVYFALDARAASDDVENATAWSSELSDREARGQRSAALAWVCAGAGVALLSAGVTVHLVSRPNRDRSAARLQLAPLPGGARAGFAHTF